MFIQIHYKKGLIILEYELEKRQNKAIIKLDEDEDEDEV